MVIHSALYPNQSKVFQRHKLTKLGNQKVFLQTVFKFPKLNFFSDFESIVQLLHFKTTLYSSKIDYMTPNC